MYVLFSSTVKLHPVWILDELNSKEFKGYITMLMQESVTRMYPLFDTTTLCKKPLTNILESIMLLECHQALPFSIRAPSQALPFSIRAPSGSSFLHQSAIRLFLSPSERSEIPFLQPDGYLTQVRAYIWPVISGMERKRWVFYMVLALFVSHT